MGSMFQYGWMNKHAYMQKWLPAFLAIGVYVSIIHWKLFEKGMKIHMMSHVKARSSTTYRVLLAKLGELPIESFTCKVSMGFQQHLAH